MKRETVMCLLRSKRSVATVDPTFGAPPPSPEAETPKIEAPKWPPAVSLEQHMLDVGSQPTTRQAKINRQSLI